MVRRLWQCQPGGCHRRCGRVGCPRSQRSSVTTMLLFLPACSLGCNVLLFLFELTGAADRLLLAALD